MNSEERTWFYTGLFLAMFVMFLTNIAGTLIMRHHYDIQCQIEYGREYHSAVFDGADQCWIKNESGYEIKELK